MTSVAASVQVDRVTRVLKSTGDRAEGFGHPCEGDEGVKGWWVECRGMENGREVPQGR